MANNEYEPEERDELQHSVHGAATEEDREASSLVEETDQIFGEGSSDDSRAPAAEHRSSDQPMIEAEREVLRVRAEMENFRKRMQRDLEQQLKYANVPLVRDLLEVSDNLQRAIGAAESEQAGAEAAGSKAVREGVAMVSQQMADVLSKYGCRRIEALGKNFDPNYHEAISQMPSEQYPAGQVMLEVAVGYMLHDRVVRPSHVIVSTGPAANS